MKSYFLLIITAISMAFVTGYFALFLQGSYTATPQDVIEINHLKGSFQKKVNPMTIINFNSLYYSREQFQLLDPLYSLPTVKNLRAIRYSTKDDCFKSFKNLLNSRNFEKVWVWERYRCGWRKNLSSNFFLEPPFIHPSGKSYAFLAFESSTPGYKNKSWVLNHLPYFHVTELKSIKMALGDLGGIFGTLSDLDQEALQSIARGEGTILSDKYLFARLKYPKVFSILEYRIYSRSKLNDFLKGSPYTLSNYQQGHTCFYKDGALCWDYNVRHIFTQANKGALSFLIGLIIIVTLVVRLLLVKIRNQKKEDDRRRLALQVLTHEFRTPVTSLLLTIEKMSKDYSKFDEATQEDLLRISSEVFRLQRLTETSRNYLKAAQNKKLIQFNYERVPSLNTFFDEFLGDYLMDYPNEFLLEPLNEDTSFCFDSYWLGTCLKNLVENALTHGSLPVAVRLNILDEKLFIEVEDQGEAPELELTELTKEFVKGNKSEGTGLGLNIVLKTIKEMGGELKLNTNPTRFTIIISDKKKKG
ncbi:MAG: DUF3404 domain-containing protein [Halobacteriovoraceae bacterium]|nr:DUF3404 domain-containing protein [Halobacteriovoraceae bacterium]MBT5092681.1 DUF3404 domain-containing protein [Halobacteriovoraceae bacterium]